MNLKYIVINNLITDLVLDSLFHHYPIQTLSPYCTGIVSSLTSISSEDQLVGYISIEKYIL